MYEWAAEGEAALALLTGLTALKLEFCELPFSLSALTGLQSLIWDCDPILNYDEGDALALALPQLQKLTCLGLIGAVVVNPPPAELDCLSGLQRLWIAAHDYWEPCVLPSGPWQSSLRWLATEWTTLTDSVQFLEGAGALEHLHIVAHAEPAQSPERWALSAANMRKPAWDWFKQRLAAHPTLRQLSFERSLRVPLEGALVLEAMSEVEAASGGWLLVRAITTPTQLAALEYAMLCQACRGIPAWQG